MSDLNEIKDDLRVIREDVSNIKTNVAVNTVDLKNHIARTEAAETRIQKLETWTLGLLTSILLALVGLLIGKSVK